MADQSAPLRRRAYFFLEKPSRAHRLSWVVEIGLIVLILANVVAVSLETVDSLYEEHRFAFRLFDTISVVIFTVEYLARVWASAEAHDDVSGNRSRWRYVRSPVAIIDLLAILPFYLALFLPLDLQLLRMLRLLRIYKLTRYSPALSVVFAVIREESATLGAAFSILAILFVLAATGAYLVEQDAQPDAFGSVPAAMWWAIVTLTTVGYGDVTPVTPIGRIFGAVVTVLGVGMAALPAGIIASGLADHLHRRRDNLRNRFRLALEDGRIDLAEGREIENLRRELGIRRDVARAIHDEVRLKHRQRFECSCPNCGHEFEVQTVENTD